MEPEIVCDLTVLVGFTEPLHSNGIVAGTQAVSAIELPRPEDVFEDLVIAKEATIYKFERIRLANDQPVALGMSYFPTNRFLGMLDEDIGGTLSKLLDREYIKRPIQAAESLELIIADARRAGL
ncbi:MAG: UTRA domain-containing protein [Acidimicrobiaceae bacterium]|nr:UTRA domain-containing protein [Acidimicrobiaceae bacterium]